MAKNSVNNIINIVVKYYDCVVSRQAILVIIAGIAVVMFIVFWQIDLLSMMQTETFLFFCTLWLLFSLYKPRWAFWLFVGFLPLEIINLAPESIQMTVRPYQITGAILLIALIILWLSGRLPRHMPRWRWWDGMMILFVASGFFAAFFADVQSDAFMQAIIVASFVVWYFLTRYFVRGIVTAKMPFLFFIMSSSIVILYGLWQSYHSVHSGISTVMAQRPNATFDEPDWLALFLVFFIACLYGVLFSFGTKKVSIIKKKWQYGSIVVLLSAAVALLVATVARSAWLGLAVVTVVFISIVVLSRRHSNTLLIITSVILSSVIGIVATIFIPLTSFALGDRVQSVGSGLQEITIACISADRSKSLLVKGFVIDDVKELSQHGCRHIDLEEIEQERASGHIIAHVKRSDPSTVERRDLYEKTITLIAQDTVWLRGIGWNQSYRYLGQDTQGVAFNTSNLFLEIWLGAGLIGLVVFLSLSGGILWQVGHNLLKEDGRGKWHTYSLFVLLGFVALFVPNIFNAGILLGFVWVFLGMAAAVQKD